MGRDGLTHNMLENIHAHWKRKRVCKIRCKGVCTVDMDNICQQLEEKVGGKVIHRQGGVIFLFRGRNYNYRTRPVFPLMLWKPAAPMYPRLVKTVPNGLTSDEATQMRKRGRQITPICKLGKNGVYANLVKEVREAFEACDLVRVDCSGLNKSDCRKIGAKLKDLVPCMLLSFEFEHILMWRGNDWRSSLHLSAKNNFEVVSDQHRFTGEENLNKTGTDSATAPSSMEVVNNVASVYNSSLSEGERFLEDPLNPSLANDVVLSSPFTVPGLCNSKSVAGIQCSVVGPLQLSTSDTVIPSLGQGVLSCNSENENPVQRSPVDSGKSEQYPDEVETSICLTSRSDEISELETTSKSSKDLNEHDSAKIYSNVLEGVLLLLKQATLTGRANVLDENEFVDAEVIYQKSVAFAKTAPRGPFLKNARRKSAVRKSVPDKRVRVNKHSVEHEEPSDAERKDDVNRRLGKQRNDLAQEFLSDVVLQGTLRVDELAKLLS